MGRALSRMQPFVTSLTFLGVLQRGVGPAGGGGGRGAWVSTYQADPKDALAYLQGAQVFAGRTTSTALPAWLCSPEARAYADMQDAHACDTALYRAEQLLERVRPEERRAGIDFFDRARLAQALGTCSMILGRAKAATVLTEALPLHPPEHEMYRALALLERAIAQADHGELEAACESAIIALSTAEEKRVGPLAQRERQLHARLGKWSAEPAVEEVRQRLAA